MRMLNLVSSDPQSTADHILQIYENPLEWWNKPEVAKLRSTFISTFASQESSPYSSYFPFLNKLLLCVVLLAISVSILYLTNK